MKAGYLLQEANQLLGLLMITSHFRSPEICEMGDVTVYKLWM